VERLAWLPAFAAVLAVLWVVFHRAERRPARGAGRGGKMAGRKRVSAQGLEV